MRNLFLVAAALLCALPARADVELQAKISPKNGAFTGLVDAKQVIGDGATNVLPDTCVAESNVTQHAAAINIGDLGNVDETGKADTNVLAYNATSGNWEPSAGGGGSGDVTGPASSTDNAICRFDGTTGKIVQNSEPTITDAGDFHLGPGDKIRWEETTGGGYITLSAPSISGNIDLKWPVSGYNTNMVLAADHTLTGQLTWATNYDRSPIGGAFSNTTYSASFYIGAYGAGANTVLSKVDLWRAPIGGTINNLRATVSVAPGTGSDKWTAEVYINGTATGYSCDIATSATTCTASGSTAVSAGDTVSVKFTETGTAAATRAGWSALLNM